MSSPQMHLRRLRPTVPPAVGRSPSLARGDAAARLLRALCALLAMLILVGPKHAEAGQSHVHRAAIQDVQPVAAGHLDTDPGDLPPEGQASAGVEHAHGADIPLASQDVVLVQSLVTSERPTAIGVASPTSQSAPGAPTPPPRSLQVPAFLTA